MKKLLFSLIMLLAFVTRFWKLDTYPALNADEAAIGYNAYSLIQTGKDEHGNPWPIHFQSFNDYKPGFYFYTVLPFVKVLGLNEWSVRIPGALAGVGSVIVIYFLANELKTKQKKEVTNRYFNIGHIAATFLAISPWAIHFSRGGWEVNLASFLMMVGVLFFIKALERPKLLLISMLAFVLSLYTYHAARIISPLLVIGMSLIYREKLFNIKKWVIAGLLLGLLIMTPLVVDFLGSAGLSRAAGVGLFADSGPVSRMNELRGEHVEGPDSLSAKLLHNKAIAYSITFVDNWSKHFWGEFLFLSGDPIQRNRVPETGQLYFYNIFLIIVGLIVLIRSTSKEHIVVVWWLIIAPIAAALTFQSPHALRAQNMVVPLTLICSMGMWTILEYIIEHKSKFIRIAALLSIVLVITISFARYEHMYWVHMSKEYPYSSQYGVKELVKYAQDNKDKYDKVIVTDRYDQPYILFLFYMKYSPSDFQKDHVLTPRDQYGFSTVRNFGKFQFESVKYDEFIKLYPHTLIAGTSGEIPDKANIVKDIYGTNGFRYFRVIAN